LYGLPLYKVLQNVDFDLKKAVNLGEASVSTFQKLRKNIIKDFQKLLEEIEVKITYLSKLTKKPSDSIYKNDFTYFRK